MSHLYDALLGAAVPEAPFLREPGGRSLSYGAAAAEAGRFAVRLAALGVSPGDRVLVQVDKSVENLLLYFGCLRAGAVLVPLNVDYTTAELDYFIADAEPRLIVCRPDRAALLAPAAAQAGARIETLGVAGEGSLLAGLAALPADFATVPRGADDLAAILYTSGTTGRSKGAMLTQANLRSNAETLAGLWQFGPADVLLHALPIFHVHGLFTATNTLMVAGGAMIFLKKFDPVEVLRLLPEATAMMGVPTFYTRLLGQAGLAPGAVRGIRLFVSGSAPLLAETHRDWQARTGHMILERYGMTETGMNTSNPYTGERRPGSVGPALPDVELRIVAPETREPLADGEVGMIEVRGPNVFAGYWKKPEQTAKERHADGFFSTGDLGRRGADGYVEIVGRAKDLVITGGFNVYPKEVEEAIDALPGVLESAVIGLPHADFGEAVTAVVVPEPGAVLDEAGIRAALAETLAPFKRPKRVLFVPALPRNTMGKVQKAALRTEHAALYAGVAAG